LEECARHCHVSYRDVETRENHGSIMNAREIQDRKATAARGMFVHQDAHANTNLESTEDQLCEAADTFSLTAISIDAASLMQALRRLEVIGKRQPPRIAFKAKGRILLLDLSDIVAVQAERNYVSLQYRPHPYLVHESLSSMAEKLKPYGFIRIHRSVLVNTSAVEEIQPLQTGEYRLRVKGRQEYLVTRKYKANLRDLAQLWVGSERLCG
jgi:DNA-binding LytR/AlgR family response regulator